MSVIADEQKTSLRREQFATVALLMLTGLAVGCEPPPEPAKSRLLNPEKTSDIGQFEAGDEDRVYDPTRPLTDPISGPLAALKNAQMQLPQLAIQQAIGLFHASEGRYPKDHAEFMQRIIAENKISLPKLPDGNVWKYDVEGHQLVAVRQPQQTDEQAGQSP